VYHNSTFEHTCAGARLHVWSDGISIGIWGTRNEAIYISGRWLLYSDDQIVPWKRLSDAYEADENDCEGA